MLLKQYENWAIISNTFVFADALAFVWMFVLHKCWVVERPNGSNITRCLSKQNKCWDDVGTKFERNQTSERGPTSPNTVNVGRPVQTVPFAGTMLDKSVNEVTPYLRWSIHHPTRSNIVPLPTAPTCRCQANVGSNVGIVLKAFNFTKTHGNAPTSFKW